MSEPWTHEEREAIAEFRRRYPRDPQRVVAVYAQMPLGDEPRTIQLGGRSYNAIYHAVRRHDQEQKKANEIAESQQATAAA